jgi:hypothetical protein
MPCRSFWTVGRVQIELVIAHAGADADIGKDQILALKGEGIDHAAVARVGVGRVD